MSAPIQRSFAGGEIAPSLHGRADQVKYATGLKECFNFFIQKHGAATNRQGTEWVWRERDERYISKLKKFVFSNSQSYIIEFGHQYIVIYHAGAPLSVVGCGAWSGATNYVAGDVVESGIGFYYCILAHINHVPPNGTYWYSMTPVNYLAIPSPYSGDDVRSLQVDQSGDVLTIKHRQYAPRDLKRLGAIKWTLTAVATAPAIAAPGGLVATPGTGGALQYSYVVTAVTAETYEESLQSTEDTAACAAPTSAAPNTLAWTAVTGAVEYSVYLDKEGNGVYGYVGTASTNAFNDPGYVPDLSSTPPIARPLFVNADTFPKTGCYYQQRHVFASSNLKPSTAWTSKAGAFNNFSVSSPIQDDDAVTFQVPGPGSSGIEHLIELGKLIALTDVGEYSIEGDQSGILLPAAINPRQQGNRGASAVTPVVVGDTVIYSQARGSAIRDLRFDINAYGYVGNDLSIFASHLFEGYSIVAMDYAQIPDSIIWCVRSDGVLLGLTYIREQQVWAWHQHVTDGLYHDVCVIPEGNYDVAYFIVRRPLLFPAAADVLYIERLTPRFFFDQITGARFLDCWTEYNGTNTDATTMTLTGSGWTTASTLTLTASSGFFTAGDVGNVIELRIGSLKRRVLIGAYTSAAVVSVTPEKNIPVALRGVATADWTRCVDELTLPLAPGGFCYLIGKTVAIYADGFVLPQQPVVAGKITLPRCYGIIAVGLPYYAEMELLNIDNPQSDVRGRQKHVTSAQLLVEKTRGLKVGMDREALTEYAPDEPSELGDVPAMVTGIIDLSVEAQWEPGGRVIIRQDDPLPATVLAVITNVDIGG